MCRPRNRPIQPSSNVCLGISSYNVVPHSWQVGANNFNNYGLWMFMVYIYQRIVNGVEINRNKTKQRFVDGPSKYRFLIDIDSFIRQIVVDLQ